MRLKKNQKNDNIMLISAVNNLKKSTQRPRKDLKKKIFATQIFLLQEIVPIFPNHRQFCSIKRKKQVFDTTYLRIFLIIRTASVYIKHKVI